MGERVAPERQFMIPVAIFLFLTGAVFSWRFRVWILVPFSVLVVVVAFLIEILVGISFAAALGYAVLIGFAPQFGYVFGLFAQNTLSIRSSPQPTSRKLAVARLYKKALLDETR